MSKDINEASKDIREDLNNLNLEDEVSEDINEAFKNIREDVAVDNFNNRKLEDEVSEDINDASEDLKHDIGDYNDACGMILWNVPGTIQN